MHQIATRNLEGPTRVLATVTLARAMKGVTQ